MKKVFLRSLFILFLLPALSLAKEIDFSDVDADSLARLRQDSPILFEAPITQNKLDQLIRAIYLYSHAKRVSVIDTNTKSGTPIFKILMERTPKIETLNVSGNVHFAKTTILSEMNMNAGENFDRTRTNFGVNRLKDFFAKNAYLKSSVTWTAKLTANKNIAVDIEINEGPISRIQEINFMTQNPNLKKGLLKIAKKYRKDPFTENLVTNLQTQIREYFADENYLLTRFMEPRFEFDEKTAMVSITYKLVDDYKFELYFEGNSHYSSRKIISLLDFANAEPLGINPAADLKERIREIYRKDAYSNMQIDYTEKKDPTEYTHSIIFKISEGKRVKIDKYTFEGGISRPPSYYKNLIVENGSDLISSGYYNAEDLDLAMKNMIVSLQNEGFLRASVIRSTVSLNEDKSKVKVFIRMEEGPITILNGVEFQGAKSFAKSTLLRTVDMQEGKALHLNQIETSYAKLADLYKNYGFLEFQVETSNEDFITYNDTNTKASIIYKITEGKRIQVDSIEVQGNNLTKEYVILKSLEFKPGEILTQEKLKESEARLKHLGLFNSVEIQLPKGETAKRNIIVKVSERNPGSLTFGVGASNELDLTLRGYTGIAYRNLFGTARALQFRIELNSNIKARDFIDYQFNASYLEPFVFDNTTKGKVSLLKTRQLTDYNNGILEATESTALTFLLEKDFTRFLKISWKVWGIEANRKFEVDTNTASEDRKIAEIGPTIELDYRDDPFVPHKGTYTRLSLDYSSPDFGSSRVDPTDANTKTVNYIRSNFSFNHYLPVYKTKSVIFAYSARAGYLKNLGREGESAVPEEKMFFLGGRSTIRGFSTNEIPNKAPLTETGDVFASMLTESVLYLIKTEFRIPIYDSFGVAVFYDGGGVQVKDKDLGDKYRDSVGFALQFTTPIGAINLGYGHKLDRKKADGESPGEIFFSIGDF